MNQSLAKDGVSAMKASARETLRKGNCTGDGAIPFNGSVGGIADKFRGSTEIPTALVEKQSKKCKPMTKAGARPVGGSGLPNTANEYKTMAKSLARGFRVMPGTAQNWQPRISGELRIGF